MSAHPYAVLVAYGISINLLCNTGSLAADEANKATVNAVCFKSPSLAKQFPGTMSSSTDVFINIKEWNSDETYLQLRTLYTKIGHNFLLVSPGRASIHLVLDDCKYDNVEHGIHGFGAQIQPSDRKKLAPGATYTLRIVSQDRVPVIIHGVRVICPRSR